MTRSLVDNAPPGSSAWLAEGVPAAWDHPGILPSVITDPADPHRTWWFWPRVQQDRIWWAVGQDNRVTWQAATVQALARLSTAALPLRVTAGWVLTLETGQGSMPVMNMEPSGAFLANIGAITGVAGWMASPGPTPHTLVLTWGLRGQATTGLRWVTVWRWRAQSGWHCSLGVLQPEPTAALAVPSAALDRWRWLTVGAVPSTHALRRGS